MLGTLISQSEGIVFFHGLKAKQDVTHKSRGLRQLRVREVTFFSLTSIPIHEFPDGDDFENCKLLNYNLRAAVYAITLSLMLNRDFLSFMPAVSIPLSSPQPQVHTGTIRGKGT